MKKENKIRLLVWGVIWLIVLALSILGVVSYYNGHGVSGEVRKSLKPIAEEFNKLKDLEQYKKTEITIEAQVEDNNIIVTYKTVGTTSTFKFEYQKLSNEKVLYMKYSSIDEATATLITKSMIEAVSITNGHQEGDVFNKYSLENFYETTIKDGIQIKKSNSSTEVYININKSIADYNPNEGEPTSKDEYIKEEDLMALNTDLDINNTYTLNKKNINLYITKTDNIYNIYLQDTNEKYSHNLYSSLISVIDTLPLTNEMKNSFSLNYSSIEGDKEFDNFIVTLDTDVETIDFFQDKRYVLRVTVAI